MSPLLIILSGVLGAIVLAIVGGLFMALLVSTVDDVAIADDPLPLPNPDRRPSRKALPVTGAEPRDKTPPPHTASSSTPEQEPDEPSTPPLERIARALTRTFGGEIDPIHDELVSLRTMYKGHALDLDLELTGTYEVAVTLDATLERAPGCSLSTEGRITPTLDITGADPIAERYLSTRLSPLALRDDVDLEVQDLSLTGQQLTTKLTFTRGAREGFESWLEEVLHILSRNAPQRRAALTDDLLAASHDADRIALFDTLCQDPAQKDALIARILQEGDLALEVFLAVESPESLPPGKRNDLLTRCARFDPRSVRSIKAFELLLEYTDDVYGIEDLLALYAGASTEEISAMALDKLLAERPNSAATMKAVEGAIARSWPERRETTWRAHAVCEVLRAKKEIAAPHITRAVARSGPAMQGLDLLHASLDLGLPLDAALSRVQGIARSTNDRELDVLMFILETFSEHLSKRKDVSHLLESLALHGASMMHRKRALRALCARPYQDTDYACRIVTDAMQREREASLRDYCVASILKDFKNHPGRVEALDWLLVNHEHVSVRREALSIYPTETDEHLCTILSHRDLSPWLFAKCIDEVKARGAIEGVARGLGALVEQSEDADMIIEVVNLMTSHSTRRFISPLSRLINRVDAPESAKYHARVILDAWREKNPHIDGGISLVSGAQRGGGLTVSETRGGELTQVDE